MQFPTAILALLPIANLVSGAPASDSDAATKKPYVAIIKGLPKDRYPDPIYVAYQPNFFNMLALDTTTDKSLALNWTINAKSDLVSTSKQTIALNPPDGTAPQAQGLSYVQYNGTQGTYVKTNKEVVNRKPYFSTWEVCSRQYGLFLLYETPGYNNSNPPPPAVCYSVKFVLQQ